MTNVQDLVKGLNLIIEGATIIRDNLALSTPNKESDIKAEDFAKVRGSIAVEPVKEVKKGKVVADTKAVVDVVEDTEEEQVEEVVTDRKAELESKTFNEIKALAKELGLKAVGTKAILIDKILEAEIVTEDEVPVEEVEEVTESHEDITEEDVEEDEEVQPEETEPTLYDKVVAELEDTSDEELADILSDIGISPKGKRQALLDKIVKAIEEGKLEFETDEEEVQEEVEEDQPETDTEVEEDGEEVEETPERLQAMEEVENEVRTAYKDKELTDKEIAEFLAEYYSGEDYKGTKSENLENYIAIQKELVDDEGDIHDFKEPYYIGERVMCCASDLKTLDNGNFYCEVCGEEYENEE